MFIHETKGSGPHQADLLTTVPVPGAGTDCTGAGAAASSLSPSWGESTFALGCGTGAVLLAPTAEMLMENPFNRYDELVDKEKKLIN